MEGSSWDAGDSLNIEDGFKPGIMLVLHGRGDMGGGAA